MARKILTLLGAVLLLLPANVGSTQAIPSQAPSKEDRTGNDLLRDCTYTVRFLDGDSQLTRDEIWVAFHCSGYLTGFVDGYGLSEDMIKFLGSTAPRLFCVPEGGLAADQSVRVVVKWLREHPERLHENGKVLVVGALQDAFPCKK